MNDKKPCPFCESADLRFKGCAYHYRTRDRATAIEGFISCGLCGAKGPLGVGRTDQNTEAAAWGLWNTRADDV